MREQESFHLPKAHEHKKVEEKWYSFWEERKFFQADAKSSKPPYSIVIPPPNVTGVLHMGHALVNTLQDILIRWKRMCGFEALWVPGTDHAGIATQTVVERHLLRTEGKKRKDFSRSEFIKIVWEWKEKNEHTILNQLKKLGCSCDFSRLRFTMDEGCNRAVKKAFKTLFDQGLIYRGDYLVNWDPVTQTALADDEVEYEERESFLWYFKYPLESGEGHITIATTRPETMLGDTAVAVSPKDPRYKHLIGKIINHPITHRKIPILADPFVDPNFGTGAVKITPAHDFNDYKMGQAHHLPFINIMRPDAHINENGGEYEGMTREDARLHIVEKMKKKELLEKIVPHLLRVGVSYRSKAILEPYLSKQWFVKVESFIPILKDAVSDGHVKIIPKNWENTYFHWVNNLRDWCISRQLWWGHQIPIWYHKHDKERMICYEGEGLPPEVEKERENWIQDEDVLDTWFSSSLWPLSTLGWPEKTPDLEKFYPTSVLVTGHDILIFWVARMIFMDKFLSTSYPFKDCFLHGLIYGKSYWHKNPDGGITYITGHEKKQYDLGEPLPKEVESKWEKLSKSKGNVIDPLELIEEYGTDALRMSLCASANQTPQIDLDRRRFEEFKNFANKLWNGARFIFLNLEGLTGFELSSGMDRDILALEDKWILSLLNKVNKNVNDALDQYSFDLSAACAYDFYWKDFCAYYLEIAKPVLFGKRGSEKDKKNKQKILVIVLCNAIRLMHPMAPFITEELFQLLKERFPTLEQNDACDPYTRHTILALKAEACAIAPYPQAISEKDIHPEIETTFSLMENLVYGIRNIRGEMKIPPNVAIAVYIEADPSSLEGKIVEQNKGIIAALVKTDHIEVLQKAPSHTFSASHSVQGLQVIIPLPSEMREKEEARLSKEKEKISEQIERLKAQLKNPQFLERAKPELVKRQEETLLELEDKLKDIEVKLSL